MPIAARVDEQLHQVAKDQARAKRFLRRASWVIVIVLGTLALSMWIAPYAQRAGYARFVSVLRFGAAIEFFSLIGLVVLLRRGLAKEIANAAQYHELLIAQNTRLKEQNGELEGQSEQLQEQATELELQAEALEKHTRELEKANRGLQDHAQRQQVLVEEARWLNRRLAEATRVARLGYWEIDSATGAVYWSDEMYRLAQLEVGIQPPPTDLYIKVVHPDDRPRLQSIASAAVSNLSEFSEQYRLVYADGSVRTVQSIGRVLGDEQGGRRLVGTVQDITDRVNLETQLRRAQKMEAIGQLAGGVAHDFNNVLTVIEGYTSLLLGGRPSTDNDLVPLTEIRDAARRAAALTRQLLAFSRQQVLQPAVLDINQAIGGVEKMLGRLIGEHIEFYTKLDTNIDPVKADPSQLEQVLMNLVVNARDAMVNGGVLTIETANVLLDSGYASRHTNVRPGHYVMLAVTDTGTGIAPADLDHIFEPFFTTKESGKGTGLGLSTVLGIVEQSGGHINVYSEPGRGTTFKVYLPRVDAAERALQMATVDAAARAGTETILLVEDDSAVRTVAATVLRRAGYTIIETDNGVDALRVCQDPAAKFDLVLSDMVMPGLGGRALAGHLERLRPTTPVLLMSGYTRDAMMNNSELTATSLFVEKPFTPDALKKKVRDALDRGRRELVS